jgi:membrane associated rhomboid family serine protease
MPLIATPIIYPCTSAIIGACCLVCYLLNIRGLGYGDVGSSYRLVVVEGQWWRTVTASFSHLSLIHLGFNAYSTWQLKEVSQTSLGGAVLCTPPTEVQGNNT